jgi:hypothetical protein
MQAKNRKKKKMSKTPSGCPTYHVVLECAKQKRQKYVVPLTSSCADRFKYLIKQVLMRQIKKKKKKKWKNFKINKKYKIQR